MSITALQRIAARFVPDQGVAVRVAAPETTLHQQVKNAGGHWDAQRHVWKLRYDRVVALGLSKRIVEAEND